MQPVKRQTLEKRARKTPSPSEEKSVIVTSALRSVGGEPVHDRRSTLAPLYSLFSSLGPGQTGATSFSVVVPYRCSSG